MVQILPKASNAWENFGIGFGSGLEELARLKLQRMQQSQEQTDTAKQLVGLGIPEEKALAISKLPPKIQEVYIKDMLQGLRGANLGSVLGSLYSSQQGPMQPMSPGSSMQPSQRDIPQPDITETDYIINRSQQQSPQAEGLQPIQPVQAQRPRAQEVQPIEDESMGPRIPPVPDLRGLNTEERKLAMDAYQKLRESAEKRYYEQKRSEESKESERTKYIFPEVKRITKNYSNKKEELRMLNEMERLNKDASDTPGWNALIEALKKGKILGTKVSLDLSGLLGPESQAFTKLTNQLAIEKLGTLKGGKPTEKILETIRSGIPNLLMSPKGRELVLRMNKEATKLDLLEYPAMKEVVKNKKISPMEFVEKVEDRYQELREKKVDKFVKKYKKEMDELLKKKQVEQVASTYNPKTGAYNVKGNRPIENIDFSTDSEFQSF